MAEYVHLVGVEDIERAGRNIVAAGDQMTRAAENIAAALAQHQQFMNDWLDQLRAALQEDRQYRILQR